MRQAGYIVRGLQIGSLLMLSGCSSNPPLDVVSDVSVVDFGEYRWFGLERTGKRVKHSGPRVRAAKGSMFGFRYKVELKAGLRCGEIGMVLVVPTYEGPNRGYRYWFRGYDFDVDDDNTGVYTTRFEVCAGQEYSAGFFFPDHIEPVPVCTRSLSSIATRRCSRRSALKSMLTKFVT